MEKIVVREKEEPPSAERSERSGSDNDEKPPSTGIAVQAINPAIQGHQQALSNSYLLKTPKSIKISIPPHHQGIVGKKTLEFKKKYFPGVTRFEWNDWRWQLKHRITSAAGLSRFMTLWDQEIEAMTGDGKQFPVSITPFYVSLIAGSMPDYPLRMSVVPTCSELVVSPLDRIDPLEEHHDSPCDGLVHRYPDRVLFLATDFCSTYCRYCTRSRIVGRDDHFMSTIDRWEKAVAYIEEHTEVRDVLISGGDPLTLSTERLEWLISRIRRIQHVEIIRMGTKAPVVLPQRITKQLCAMLKKYHPLLMSIHFTHPDELTPETVEACGRLADAGIPLGSQTVLLKGVNDSVDVMKKLMQGLLKARVKPYYLYQCDPVVGTSHFRTTVEKGIEIISGLQGHTTGYAVPTFVVDAPGGGGKIPVYANRVAGRQGSDLLLTNYEGKVYSYPDPEGRLGSM
ncbi:MAG: KamA family radical SAM protein [Spirochaetales bacterium]|nr:MAG: KamA family radical SAM protein [Spirochaetales bacterium]